MAKGRIKDFKDDRGFGFIARQGGGDDVFFHVSAVRGDKEAILTGAEVSFEEGPTRTGKVQATSVTVLSAPPSPAANVPQGARRSPPAGLPDECVFDSLADEEGRPKIELFKGPPETAAVALQRAGLKATQFRQVYTALQSIAAALRKPGAQFEDARPRFASFYAERVVRQAKRGLLPSVAQELFDRHWDLALSSRDQMLAFVQYVKAIYCYFEDKGGR